MSYGLIAGLACAPSVASVVAWLPVGRPILAGVVRIRRRGRVFTGQHIFDVGDSEHLAIIEQKDSSMWAGLDGCTSNGDNMSRWTFILKLVDKCLHSDLWTFKKLPDEGL